MRRSVLAALSLSFALAAVPPPVARAIPELEAEENIAELMPATFPTDEVADDVSSRPWALLPQIGFGPDTGFLLGAKFAHRDVFDSGVQVDFAGAYSLLGVRAAAFSVAQPNLLDRQLLLLFRVKYDYDPQREFFGLGNNDVGPTPLSTNLFGEVAGALTVGWRPFEQLAFNLSIGLRFVEIGNGRRKDDLPFTPEAFPDLTGIDGGFSNPFMFSIVWNDRDSVMRPTRGWRVILKLLHATNVFGSDFTFTRYVFDAGYLRSFDEGRHVIGARVDGEWIDGSSRATPYWELCELGGADTLRGFFPHRFLGKGRVFINLEYRLQILDFDFFDLWRVHLDGVLFGDTGRVFLDSEDIDDEFGFDADVFERVVSDFRYSYGTGVRFALSEAIVARIDVGFSEEETGLVYLSFGHTF